MKIIINDAADIVSHEPGSTLGQILTQLREFLRKNGLVASIFEIDGNILSTEMERDLAPKDVEGFSELKVIARDLKTACTDLLDSVEEAVPSLITLTQKVAEDLYAGRGDKVEAGLKDVLLRFVDVQQGLGMVGTLSGHPLEELIVDGTAFGQKATDMKNIHKELQDNISNADVQALAETLEYEFAERLTEWARAAVVMRETISTAFQDADASD